MKSLTLIQSVETYWIMMVLKYAIPRSSFITQIIVLYQINRN